MTAHPRAKVVHSATALFCLRLNKFIFKSMGVGPLGKNIGQKDIIEVPDETALDAERVHTKARGISVSIPWVRPPSSRNLKVWTR